MVQKYITALRESKAQTIENRRDLNIVKTSVISTLIRIYGEKSNQQSEVESQMEYRGYRPAKGDHSQSDKIALNERIKSLHKLIDGFIYELEQLGIPEKETPNSSTGVNLHVQQNNHQELNVSLNFITQTIKKELTGDQLKELLTILENKKIPDDEKKKTIFEKLKSFGSDVLSNVVAGIITNPSLIDTLIK